MSYLVPDSELSAGGFTSYGSGASNVARINTAPTSDTSNGILASTAGSLTRCGYGLGNPAVSVNTASDVKIGIICAAEDPLGLGKFDFEFALYEGGMAGTKRASVVTSRNILSTGVFSGTEYTLSGGEKAAVTSWNDVGLVVENITADLASGTFYISEIWLEYTESGGGGGTSRRRNLPLMGVG